MDADDNLGMSDAEYQDAFDRLVGKTADSSAAGSEAPKGKTDPPPKGDRESDGSKSGANKSKTSSKSIRAFYSRKNPSGHASSFDNAITAIDRLGIDCRYDVFHDRMLVSGHVLQLGTDGNLDSVSLMVRRLIVDSFQFDPGAQNTFDAIKSRCLDNMFDPVADYLAGL